MLGLIEELNIADNEKKLKSVCETVINSENLIKYLNDLKHNGIQLEDLVDVIDDTSMESDALI